MAGTHDTQGHDCPVCGNRMTKLPGPDKNTNASHERTWRCQYCRQLLTARFERRPGKKRPRLAGFEACT